MKLSIEPCLWEEPGQISKYLNQLFEKSVEGIEHIWIKVYFNQFYCLYQS